MIKLTSREDYKLLGQYARAYNRGEISRESIPYKYRIHIPETREESLRKQEEYRKEFDEEQERFSNSTTGKALDAVSKGLTTMIAVPSAAGSLGPIVTEPISKMASSAKNLYGATKSALQYNFPRVYNLLSYARQFADIAGTGLGMYNFFGPEGYRKTQRLLKDGSNPLATIKSALGDALDFLGPIDLAYNTTKWFSAKHKLKKIKDLADTEAKDTYKNFIKINEVVNRWEDKNNSWKINPFENKQVTVHPYKSDNILTLKRTYPQYNFRKNADGKIVVSDIKYNNSWGTNPQLNTPDGKPLQLQTQEGILNTDGSIVSVSSSKPVEYPRLTQETIDHIRTHIQSTIAKLDPTGGNVKVFGSTPLTAEGAMPHISDDIDIITTQKYFDSQGWKRGGGAKYGGTVTVDGNPVDINIIEQGNDGFATGDLAEQLFAKQFPNEYHTAKNHSIITNTPLKINKTPDELLQSFDSVEDTILDILLSDKDKHKSRVPVLFEYANPKTLMNVLHRKGQMLYGNKYLPLAQLDYSNVDSNLDALNKIGYSGINPQAVASNPERMKLVMEEWYQGISGGFRSADRGNNFQAFNQWQNKYKGGTGSGAGLNAVDVSGHNWMGDTQAHLQWNVNDYISGKTPSQAFDEIQSYDLELGKSLSQDGRKRINEFLALPDVQNLLGGLYEIDGIKQFDRLLRDAYNKLPDSDFSKLSDLIYKYKPVPYVKGKYNSHGYFGGLTTPSNLDQLPLTTAKDASDYFTSTAKRGFGQTAASGNLYPVQKTVHSRDNQRFEEEQQILRNRADKFIARYREKYDNAYDKSYNAYVDFLKADDNLQNWGAFTASSIVPLSVGSVTGVYSDKEKPTFTPKENRRKAMQQEK